jgi:hypothetical protein
MQNILDELKYRITLLVLTICGVLTVASIAAHYARFCMFGGGEK